MRLELPVFEGSDPDGWIFKVEGYFEFNGLQANERLRAALLCMERDALAWYIWQRGNTLFVDGKNLRKCYCSDSDQAKRVISMSN